MNHFAQTIQDQKYLWKDIGEKDWTDIAFRVTKEVLAAVGINIEDSIAIEIFGMIREKKFIPGGRYLYAAGRPFHQVQNCLLMRADDSREGWAQIMQDATMALMTGAGIGINYSQVRAEGEKISRTGGKSTGPIALMQMVNEAGRWIMQGGSRRSAIWAGLSWKHKDILKFVELKNWRPEVKALKAKDFNFPAPMDGTNISVDLDDEFFQAFHDVAHPLNLHAQVVYWKTIRQMMETGEPGFSINVGANAGEDLRNACTEVSSRDDSDICNIGSINMANIESLEEMKRVTELGTLFLIAGTVYSHIPYDKVGKIREKNRRLGLGLMGLHEWLLLRGKKYGPDAELEEYLKIYAKSGEFANEWCDECMLSRPVKTRAIAPTGTISIIAETSSGIEPILCVAKKRRYLEGLQWNYQYVVDSTAARLIEKGVPVDLIEDAYSIDWERRVAFQAWVQQYVDHGISSTINLPSWGSETNNEEKIQEFGQMLMKYLPMLRGITTYPDGSRGGQPISKVDYKTAVENQGMTFYEGGDICSLSNRGTCGS